MGADVSLSRRVAAFPHDGGVLYAAIERSYDKKDGPSRAHEVVTAFGTYAIALARRGFCTITEPPHFASKAA